MPEQPHNSGAQAITLNVNGANLAVAAGTSVAAAILIAGSQTRTSVTGEPRAPLCGMGICFECRATINGIAHRRSCQVLCESGMEVRTQ
ncbi:MAG: (2Fe-2S)-binding protein [Acidobacteriaceae bacterium]